MIFFIGVKALFILLFALAAPVFGYTYRFIGKKVNTILGPAQESGEKAIAALIVHGIIESPGVVILLKESIVFHPKIKKPR